MPRRQYRSVMTGRDWPVVEDTPRIVAERFALVVWSEAALLDMRREFPTLTPDNFEAADTFRVERTRELLAAVGVRS